MFLDPVYFIQGNGASGQHDFHTPYPTVNYYTYRTLSIYMKIGTKIAHISVRDDIIFVNFDLELGVLGNWS